LDKNKQKLALWGVWRRRCAAKPRRAACFVIRALALHDGWSLPVYRAREGRTVEEVEAERLGK